MKRINQGIIITIVLVWLINGLYCKILGGVPRHQIIISEILGHYYASIFNTLIGVSEVLMAIWVYSRLFPKTNAILQIVIVMTMNIIEFTLVSNHLLFGKWNILFATFFCLLIYYQTFVIEKKHTEPSIKRARKLYPSVFPTTKIKTYDFPFPKESFDHIFVIFSAHEIRNEEERIIFLKS